jgi:hypothetical protein
MRSSHNKGQIRRRLALVLALCLAVSSASAAQFKTFGADEVHYIVVPTEFIKADVAAEYGIVRGPNRAFVNISVLLGGQEPVRATVTGSASNLLGQRSELDFREVTEGDAIYYIAQFKHSREDQLRFTIQIQLPDRPAYDLEFEHKVYQED